MNIALYADRLSRLEADLLAVPVYEGALAESKAFTEIDEALSGLLTRAAGEEEFTGKAESRLSVHANGELSARRVLVVGLGKRDAFVPTGARTLTVAAARRARGISASTLGIVAPDVEDWQRERTYQALAEGLTLGAYVYDAHKSEKKPFPVSDVLVAVPGVKAAAASDARDALQRGGLIAACVNQARDLVNGPAADVTPTRMAEFARELAREHDLKLKVLDRRDCEKLGMGMYLAVARGSKEEPKFIHLTYTPPKKKPVRTVALVGKGVTFDSGGLSLKTPKGMEGMKTDMAGGAAVLACMEAIARLRPPVRVHAICAATENMPSGDAYRPGDIVHGMTGKSVEVLNTDAEGRLTLGDALAYAVQQEPDEIIELSTLTGACVVALGNYTVGLMATNDELAERFLAGTRDAGEDFWRLPLVERIADDLKTEMADVKNIGTAYGGAIAAGLFLRDYVGDIPFIHNDIAGPSSADKPWGPHRKGATGVGVMSLVEYITRTVVG